LVSGKWQVWTNRELSNRKMHGAGGKASNFF